MVLSRIPRIRSRINTHSADTSGIGMLNVSICGSDSLLTGKVFRSSKSCTCAVAVTLRLNVRASGRHNMG